MLKNCIFLSIFLLIIIIIIIIMHYYYYPLIFSSDYIISKNKINYSLLHNAELQKDKINLYFINLKSSIERKNRFLNRLSNYSNYNIYRFNAITPNDLKYIKLNYNLRCYIMSKYEKSCLLSHLYAIANAYKNNDNYALICEDDMILKKNINWEYLISILPNDWDILQLHSWNYPFFNNSKYTKIKQKSFIYKTNNVFISAVMYLISKKGMHKIINKYFTNSLNINLKSHNKYCLADFLIYNNMNRYILNYPIIDTEELDSTISDTYLYSRKLYNLLIN